MHFFTKHPPFHILQLQTRTLLSLLAVWWSGAKVHETTTFWRVTLRNIHRFKNTFHCRLSNKPFLIWLLTTLPRLKYVAAPPCNLSLMACFLTMFHKVVWQHTQGMVGLLIYYHLTANLPRNLTAKNAS